MKTKFFLILLFIMTSVCTFADRKCSACKGTGRVVYTTGISTFGLNDHRRYCSECGEYHYLGHAHKNCTICHGQGYISSSESSSGGGYEMDPSIAAWATYTVQTQKYGVPLTQEEIKALNEFYKQNQVACTDFQGWINVANFEIIINNKNTKNGLTKYIDPAKERSRYETNLKNLNALMTNVTLPNSVLQNLYNRMLNSYKVSWDQYISSVSINHTYEEKTRILEDDILWRMQFLP